MKISKNNEIEDIKKESIEECKQKKETNIHDVKIVAWICLSLCVIAGVITTKNMACLSVLIFGLFI